MVAKKKAPKSLKAGRPPLTRPSGTMSRKASRTLINKHHQLDKQRRQAASKGDKATEDSITAEMETLGGISLYQQASLQGQSTERGGDTSRLLLEWLPVADLKGSGRKLRLLEVGSLSTRNACSLSGLFDPVHIDLNSQEPGILQQDFMDRPVPMDDTGRFDVLSLSLVLNFVPDAALRGEMLKRTLEFLRSNPPDDSGAADESLFPCLFTVLPRNCLDNSRYFTEARFEYIMGMLGYSMMRKKTTLKLAYNLWRKVGGVNITNVPKKEINPGRTRNNFVITLQH
ncbi:hypothetical protein CCM_05840 [Cordyceps militaris CM01]|uniref:25S rRNA adenine-N(1) methyltransferase n=1 Tax=Cordyceps militaris (strain CM01) TaxID=983644 RepID=G3JHC6_CORMM|nr:uncharacterized protein CCM_05840 [Cordyceps militaris CM01]EGX91682.1 hypothetical protein CCM_05840 [Cordyceps militaris CM01]